MGKTKKANKKIWVKVKYVNLKLIISTIPYISIISEYTYVKKKKEDN